MLPTPALTDRFKGLGLRPLSRPRVFLRDGHPCIELAGAMVHLSWPLRAYMSGDGYLSGGVAAGLPVATPLCLVAGLSFAPPCARRGFALPCASCPRGIRLLSVLPSHLRGSGSLSRSSLLGSRPLLGFSPPPVSLRSHLCSQPGIISFAKTPRGLFGRAARRFLSRRNGDGKPSSPLP